MKIRVINSNTLNMNKTRWFRNWHQITLKNFRFLKHQLIINLSFNPAKFHPKATFNQLPRLMTNSCRLPTSSKSVLCLQTKDTRYKMDNWLARCMTHLVCKQTSRKQWMRFNRMCNHKSYNKIWFKIHRLHRLSQNHQLMVSFLLLEHNPWSLTRIFKNESINLDRH